MKKIILLLWITGFCSFSFGQNMLEKMKKFTVSKGYTIYHTADFKLQQGSMSSLDINLNPGEYKILGFGEYSSVKNINLDVYLGNQLIAKEDNYDAGLSPLNISVQKTARFTIRIFNIRSADRKADEPCYILIARKTGTENVLNQKPDIDSKTNALCSDLQTILSSLQQGKLADLVDYNKPLGLTRSWYLAKVPLAGFNQLKGQNLMGNLSFTGKLVDQSAGDKKALFEETVAAFKKCLPDFEKEEKVAESSPYRIVSFLSKRKKITVRLEYDHTTEGYKGIYIEMWNR